MIIMAIIIHHKFIAMFSFTKAGSVISTLTKTHQKCNPKYVYMFIKGFKA